MKRVTVYTAGACSGNPGIGGWGAVLMFGDHKKEISGAQEHTNNNRMDVSASIQAVSALKYACLVDLYSDSAYTVNAFTEGWIYGWVRIGWKKADKKEVLNADLWQELLLRTIKHKVTFHKVKGHADNEYNNRCDLLATSAIKEYKKQNGIE